MSFVLRIQQVVGFFHGDVYHGVESVKTHQTNKILTNTGLLPYVEYHPGKNSPSLDIVP